MTLVAQRACAPSAQPPHPIDVDQGPKSPENLPFDHECKVDFSLSALTSGWQISDKEKNMRAALLVAAIAGLIFGAYAYQSSGSDKSKEPKQQSSTNTGSTTEKPKLGYPDPYIPPTKGNGF